jgi:HK97 family phage major capsid protein
MSDLNMAEVAKTMDRLGEAVEAHRKATDERIAELKKAGTVTPETEAKLAKIDSALDQIAELKKQMEMVQTRAARPGVGASGAEPDSPEAREHREALVAWLRNPGEPERQQRLHRAQKGVAAKIGNDGWESRAAQVITSTGSAGGFALPEQIENQIARLGLDISPIRQISTVRTVGTSDYKELFDVNGAAFAWVGENGSRTQTNTSDLAERAPTMGTAYAYPQSTEEALDDLFFNVEDWLIQSASEAIAQGEGTAFVSGNGTNRPTGFLAGPTPVTTVDASRAFGTLQYIAGGAASAMPTSADVFYDMVYALRARYRANARWVTSKLVLAAMRKYKDTTNQYLWQPSLVLGQPDSFMGYPVTEAEDMPAVAANAFPVAFGDFREGYLIVDRVGMRITRDEITAPGFVKFHIRKRVGGIIRNSQAIKLLRISAT